MATETSLPVGALDRYFRITERGSTLATEIRGGLTTFFTMAYIVVLNPLILGAVPDGTGAFLGGDGGRVRIAAATALVAGVVSILMGVVANFPIALAAGLGLNAVVAFSIATLPGMTWADAMGLVVLEGVVILVLVLTGFRVAVFRAVPRELKTAISVGIGLFIAFIGLYDGGFVRQGVGTPVQLGIDGSISGWPLLVFVLGLAVAIVLTAKKVRGGLLLSVIGTTLVAVLVEAVVHAGSVVDSPTGWQLNVPTLPSSIVGVPDLSLLGHFSVFGSVSKVGLLTVVLLVFSLTLADFFDTMGTMVAIGAEADLLDDQGNPPKTQQILIVDSVAAIAGGAGSVSSNTSYIESASGVGDGARTGLASVVTGLAFLLSMVFAPLVSMVPFEAAGPVLVVVGFLMVMQVSEIDWRSHGVAIPAFLTMIAMPFTYSITVGIGVGFVSYVVLRVAAGKSREVHPLMWVTSALFVAYFALGPIKAALGV
jgi:adenine/guanine/hypoxanthine permease